MVGDAFIALEKVGFDIVDAGLRRGKSLPSGPRDSIPFRELLAR